jgi:hypothetical protein
MSGVPVTRYQAGFVEPDTDRGEYVVRATYEEAIDWLISMSNIYWTKDGEAGRDEGQWDDLSVALHNPGVGPTFEAEGGGMLWYVTCVFTVTDEWDDLFVQRRAEALAAQALGRWSEPEPF